MVSHKKLRIKGQKIKGFVLAIVLAFITLSLSVSSYAYEVNVKTQGAVGDGITDDTTVIQNAIDNAPSTGGKVYLPAGNFKITGSILIKSSNLTVVGAGYQSTTLSYSGYLPMVLVKPDSGVPLSNVRIEGIRLVNSAVADIAQGVGRSTIELDITQANISDSAISSVMIDGSPTLGISIDGNGIAVTNSVLRATAQTSILVKGSNISLSGNQIYDAIIGSTFLDQRALQIDQSSNVAIKNNTINKMRDGVSAIYVATTANQTTITENTIALSDINQIGLELHSGKVTAVGNIVDGSAGHINSAAINVKEGAGALISDTQIVGSWDTSAVIAETLATDISLDHIKIQNGSVNDWSVDFNDSTRPTIRNSSILNGPLGINLGQSIDARVVNNQVYATSFRYNLTDGPVNPVIVEAGESNVLNLGDVTIGTSENPGVMIMHNQNGDPWKCAPENDGTFTCPVFIPNLQVVATPSFIPNGGSFNGSTLVTILSATGGTSIYYTLDGSTPTTASIKYTGPITIAQTATIKAIAARPEFQNSAVASATITIVPFAEAVAFNPAPGNFDDITAVTLSSATTDAIIYYTLDGSTPTTASLVYSAPISLNAPTTINALATAVGFANSAVTSGFFDVNPIVQPVAFSPDPGVTYTDVTEITLGTTTLDATIYYTLDGSAPTVNSIEYTGPFTLSEATTVTALAVKTGFINSLVTTAAYDIQTEIAEPVELTPFAGAGTYGESVTVTLATATPGATIYYTLDGTTPSTNSLAYSEPFSVPDNVLTTVKAIAVATGFQNSDVSSGDYDVQIVVLPPDPSLVASSVATNVVTSVALDMNFLFEGANPIQTGVAPGTIKPEFTAILRGQLFTRDGNPLPGATVSILGHPEFGQTLTRADGFYDMAVNGGGLLTLEFKKTNFLTAQRKIDTPWIDFAMVEDVALVPLNPKRTVVDLANETTVAHLAEGSVEIDTDGTRQVALMFPAGTTAEMVLPDGSKLPLTTMTVRSTEYTVGDNGDMAMPAKLPPGTAYTYAVEFSIDEAIAAGADTVEFDPNKPPVMGYLENFLGFPIGGAVPNGFYERTDAKWVGDDNGIVLQIASVTNGLADIAIDDQGALADATFLAELEITDTERELLAQRYAIGDSFWRVPMRHFSTRDWNGIDRPSPDAKPPVNPPAKQNPSPPLPDCDCDKGSIIRVQGQVLGESVPITGTPFNLNYSSDRQLGYGNRSMDIPLIGGLVPNSLTEIELTVNVAGQTHKFLFEKAVTPILPNLTQSFTWNGLDAYGRPVNGSATVVINIRYRYVSTYPVYSYRGLTLVQSLRIVFLNQYLADGFATPVGTALTRRDFSFDQEYSVQLQSQDARPLGFGGWSLDQLHTYDSLGPILYRGDGVRRTVGELRTINSVTGESGISIPEGITVAPNGDVFYSQRFNVFKLDRDGVVTTVAGNGQQGCCGNGGLALDAVFNFLAGTALDPEGNLYIADPINHRVVKVHAINGEITPQSILTTIVGNGDGGGGGNPITEGNGSNGQGGTQKRGSYTGDGGLAVNAGLARPTDVAIGPNGSIFIVDSFNQRIRRVDPSGIIDTIAGAPDFLASNGGNWSEDFSGDDGPAVEAKIGAVTDLGFGPDGSLYLVLGAFGQHNRIIKIDRNGTLTTYGGGGNLGDADGIAATDADLFVPKHVVVDQRGNVYFGSNNGYRYIDTEGIIHKVTPKFGDPGVTNFIEKGPAKNTVLSGSSIAVAPDGTLYVGANGRLVKISPSIPGFENDDQQVASADGSEIYNFDKAGRHKQTLNSLTGAVIFTFAYDGSGRLITSTDADGLVTTFNRDASGNLTSITSPDGQTTAISLNGNGFIASIANPASETIQLSYNGNEGLLTSFTDARQNASTFTYNGFGRLTQDKNAENGELNYAKTILNEFDNRTTKTTSLGRVTTFDVEFDPNGTRKRTVTDPSGIQTVSFLDEGGTQTVNSPDGTVTLSTPLADPRFGMQSPLNSLKITTPSGLINNVTSNRTVDLTDLNNPFSLTKQTDTVNVNGKTFSSVFEKISSPNPDPYKEVSTSPEGRTLTSFFDSNLQLTKIEAPGFSGNQLISEFSYDARSRLISTLQGTSNERNSSIVYDSVTGFTSSITDSLGRSVSFTYDSLGRVTKQTLPGAREINFTYDANGNVTSIQPPGQPVHLFQYDSIDQETFYTPPDVNPGTDATMFSYNLDKDLTSITRPDGGFISFAYDTGGRLQTLTFPRSGANVSTTYSYETGTGDLKEIIAPDGGKLTFVNDGPLPTEFGFIGQVAGSVVQTYDNDFRVTSRSVNGANSLNFTYDNDSLVTGAGSETLTYDSGNGFLTGTTLGLVTDSLQYSAEYGELQNYSAVVNGTEQFKTSFIRDDLGRITEKTETVKGVETTYTYDYDIEGRLISVDDGDTIPEETYTYDSNGNRSINGAQYDAQDRLTSLLDGTTYTYSANGELASKTDPNLDTTVYEYDALGNLISVDLPGGVSGSPEIEYIVDGQNRRIGKKFNGTLEKTWLYKDQFNPIAELDGLGNVVSRFVYASRSNVPDYMIKGGITYRIISDHLGSPRIVVDSANSNVIVQEITYDTFGRVLSDTNPGFQPFGFAGGIYDGDTKFTRFGARDYDTEIGRWTSKDPILFDGGGTNLYGYVLNDPINFIDINGLEPRYISNDNFGAKAIIVNQPQPFNDPLSPYLSALTPDSSVGFDSPLGGFELTFPLRSGGAPYGKAQTPSRNFPLPAPGCTIQFRGSFNGNNNTPTFDAVIDSPLGSLKQQYGGDYKFEGRKTISAAIPGINTKVYIRFKYQISKIK